MPLAVRPSRLLVAALVAAAAALPFAGCGPGANAPLEPDARDTTATVQPPPVTPPPPPAPPPSASAELLVGGWNIEWFGSTSNGPTDEARQLRNARDMLLHADADVWGVAEIVSQGAWDELERQLPGYAGFVASEPVVAGGAASYGATEQKVAILYDTTVATLVRARIILASSDYAFGGRPPLEVTLRVARGGSVSELVVIVHHMKAFDDATSWQRRRDASAALKGYLDATYPTQRVVVVGDWNDDIDTSISAGRASPFANFTADTARYRFPTAALTARRVSSTTSYPEFIDHHLATDELAAAEVPGSVRVVRGDSLFAQYSTTTSDHYPVLSRYRLP